MIKPMSESLYLLFASDPSWWGATAQSEQKERKRDTETKRLIVMIQEQSVRWNMVRKLHLKTSCWSICVHLIFLHCAVWSKKNIYGQSYHIGWGFSFFHQIIYLYIWKNNKCIMTAHVQQRWPSNAFPWTFICSIKFDNCPALHTHFQSFLLFDSFFFCLSILHENCCIFVYLQNAQ